MNYLFSFFIFILSKLFSKIKAKKVFIKKKTNSILLCQIVFKTMMKSMQKKKTKKPKLFI